MMQLSDPSMVTLCGDLGERLARAIRHLHDLDSEVMWHELEHPDEIWHWGADYPGRWVGTMALLSGHTGEDYSVRRVAERLIGYQQPDGGFSPYSSPTDYKEWFGMGRGLAGLVDYHAATGDEHALNAAHRLATHYADRYPSFGPYMYECYSNALEGLVAVTRLTDDPRLRKAAQRMADCSMVFQHVWQSTTISPQGRRSPCGGQIHCQLTTARGLLDLYELSGEARYLAPVLALHDYVCRNTLSIAGGVGFYFNRPEENEACADADWLRLNLQLWRLLGESRFLDLAEQTLINQIPFVQASNGAFCYLRGLQNRSGAAFDVCCSHHVPRALWEVMRYAVTAEAGSLSVNLFLDATTAVPLVGGDDVVTLLSRVRIEPELFAVDLELAMASPATFAVRVRVPTWAGSGVASVDGDAVPSGNRPGEIVVERKWQNGTRITVSFPNRARLERGHRIGEHLIHDDEAAVLFGPRVFCLTDLHNPTVPQHLVRLQTGGNGRGGITVEHPDRLIASGVGSDGSVQPVVFTPISATGGNPNGIGRSHPALAPPFRVWIPIEEGGIGHRALVSAHSQRDRSRPPSREPGLTWNGSQDGRAFARREKEERLLTRAKKVGSRGIACVGLAAAER
jgi:hypothetical protein